MADQKIEVLLTANVQDLIGKFLQAKQAGEKLNDIGNVNATPNINIMTVQQKMATIQGAIDRYKKQIEANTAAGIDTNQAQMKITTLQTRLRQLSVGATPIVDVNTGAADSKLAELRLKAKQVADQLRQPIAGGLFENLKTQAADLQGRLNGVKDSMLAFGIAVAGGMGLVSLIKNAATAGNAIYILQTRLNSTTKEAMDTSKLLQLSGVEATSFTTAMSKLSKGYQSAGKAGQDLRDTLKDQGVVLTDTNGKMLSVPQQLSKLGEAYAEAQKTGDGFNFAMTVFQRNAMTMIPLMDDMATKMEVLSRMKTSGIAMDPKTAHEDVVNIQVLEMQLKQFANVAGRILAPIADDVLVPLTTALATVAEAMKEWKVIPAIIAGAVSAFASLKLVSMVTGALGTANVIAMSAAFSGAVGPISKVTAAFKSLTIVSTISTMFSGAMTAFRAAPTILGGLSLALRAVGVSMYAAMGPIGLIVAAVGLAVAAYALWQGKKREADTKALADAKALAQANADTNAPKPKKTLTAEEKEEAKQKLETEKEIQEQIYALTHSGTEKAIHDIELKAQKYRDDGMDEVLVAKLVSEEKIKIRKEEAERIHALTQAIDKSKGKNAIDIARAELDFANEQLSKTNSSDQEAYLKAQQGQIDAQVGVYKALTEQASALGQFVYTSQKLIAEANAIDATDGDSTIKRYEAKKAAITDYLSEMDKIRASQLAVSDSTARMNIIMASTTPSGKRESGEYWVDGIKNVVSYKTAVGFNLQSIEMMNQQQDSMEKVNNTNKLNERLGILRAMLSNEKLGAEQRKQLIVEEKSVFASYTKGITDGIADAMSKIQSLQSKAISSANSVMGVLDKFFPESSYQGMKTMLAVAEDAWAKTDKHSVEQMNALLNLQARAKELKINPTVKINASDVMQAGMDEVSRIGETIDVLKANMNDLISQAKQIGAKAANNYFAEWNGYIDQLKQTIGGALALPVSIDITQASQAIDQIKQQFASTVQGLQTSMTVELPKPTINYNTFQQSFQVGVNIQGNTLKDLGDAVNNAKDLFGRELKSAFEEANLQYGF